MTYINIYIYIYIYININKSRATIRKTTVTLQTS